MKLTTDLPMIDRDRLYDRAAKTLGDAFDPTLIGIRELRGDVTCKAVKDSAQGGYELDGMASTSEVDQDEEVVLQDGIDWTLLDRYKAVYADHAYGMSNVVGTVRWIKRRRHGLVDGWNIRVKLYGDEFSDQARQARMLGEANAAAFSFGFLATDRGPLTVAEKAIYPKARTIVRKSRAFEVSVTAMPCNLSCGATLLLADSEKVAAVGELIAKGLAPAWVGGRFRAKKRRVFVCV